MEIKVLILFETFHLKTGGGITLTNLFKDFDKSLIANCSTQLAFRNCSDDSYCSNYYILGDKEFKSPFPISLFYKWGKSGGFSQNMVSTDPNNNNITPLIPIKAKRWIKWIIDKLGFTNKLYSINISEELLNWINAFQPAIIYAQPGSKATCLFIEKISKQTGLPVVLHVMDDWISVKHSSFTNNYIKDSTPLIFSRLIKSADSLFTISEGMQKAYRLRYDKDSTVFHNTLDIDKWIPFSKRNYEIGFTARILYSGRIGIGISRALLKLINAIQDLVSRGQNIKLHIQSTSIDDKHRAILSHFNFIHINNQVDYDELPRIFSAYDILILPIDFNGTGETFLKYSMPTKVPEFMISGTPILLYAPKDIYLYQHAVANKWAHIIKGESKDDLLEGLTEILENYKIRKDVSTNAFNYAMEYYDGEKIRKRFKDGLTNIYMHNRKTDNID